MPETDEVLFISDLHLRDERPDTLAVFRHLLETRGPRIQALYILGDLFDVWVGEDDPAPAHRVIETTLARASDAGATLHYLPGNRDYLIAHAFGERTGCSILPDPFIAVIHGQRTVLTHGDVLCTGDIRHQEYRAQAYAPEARAELIARSLEERLEVKRQAREKREERKRRMSAYSVDVDPRMVEDTLRAHDATRIIHGHTHRPAIHRFALDGTPAERIVLQDWDVEPGGVILNASGPRHEAFHLPPR